MWRSIAFTIALSAFCTALPAQDNSYTDNDLEGFGDCLKKDTTSCLKYKFLSFVDKMIGQKETFSLADGVTVVRASDAPIETGAPRSLDPAMRLRKYLETHSVRVELNGRDVMDAISNTGRALEETFDSFTDDGNEVEESRGKKKKSKVMGPLMAMMAMKMAAMVPLALGVIAIIAGKALLIGKIALVLSSIIGLKKLLSQQKHVTYEVVAHPHHSSSHTASHSDYGASSGYGGDTGGYSSGGGGGGGGGGSGHGGWGRSFDAQTIAYSAQKP